MSDRIIEWDVMEGLKCIPDDYRYKVIIADPPYNIGKDFGTSKDQMPLDEYVEWCMQWILRCKCQLSDDGIMYIYGLPEVLAHISSQYKPEDCRYLVWHYTNKTVPSSKFWQRSHESILCLWPSDSERPILNVDNIREPYTDGFIKGAAGKTRKATPSRFGNKENTIYEAHPDGALPREVIKVPALAGGSGRSERWFMCMSHKRRVFSPEHLNDHRDCQIMKHPTQKPAELTRRLLLSNIERRQGGRVLIPFAGSGSECVVAKSLGIDYTGIEINPDYVEFAEKWLEQTEYNSA